MSRMIESNVQSTFEGMDIIALSTTEAQSYLIKRQAIEIYEIEFGFLEKV